MNYTIREMGLGDILDQAIKLVRNHFKRLFLLCSFLYLPVVLIQGFLELSNEDPMSMGLDPVGILFTVFIMLIATPITNAAITHSIAKEYLGQSASAKESFVHALKVVIPLIFTSIISGICIMLGFVVLIIPGIILIFGLILTSQIVILEGKSGFSAVGRSWELMKGSKGTAFVLNFVLGIIMLAGFFGVGVVSAISPAVGVLLMALVQLLAVMLGAAAFVVLYFSARCKHEQFDMMLLARALGTSAPQQPQQPVNTNMWQR